MANGEEVEIIETEFECVSCGYTRFAHTQAALDRRTSPFAAWPWLKEPVDVYMCARCGFMHWFGPVLEDVDECIECGAPLAEGETVCPSCGWTYEDGEGDADEDDVNGYAADEEKRFGGGPEESDDGPTQCLECGEKMAAGVTVCPSCGWTYEAPGDGPEDDAGEGQDESVYRDDH